MRLVTYRADGATSVGALVDDSVVDLDRVAPDMLTLIRGGAELLEQARGRLGTGARRSLAEVELLAPVQPIRNIFCVGLNYLDHALEGAGTPRKPEDVPKTPVWFTKATTAVCGPFDDIELDTTLSEMYDWEGELAVVIGDGGRHIRPESALRHIHSYTLINDVTARDVQRRAGGQWFLGKSVDGITPFGPHLVTTDEIDDVTELEVRCSVNGALKQSAVTRDMLFDIPALIADISRFITLLPGDVIATGTPAGIGAGRVPQEFLSDGDELVTEIPLVGIMRNRIIGASGPLGPVVDGVGRQRQPTKLSFRQKESTMKLGSTELDVYEICLGGNPFGWTIDQEQSIEVLDAYTAAGGNFIDTADSYAQWVDGNKGGESETIIGQWLSRRQDRDQLVIATKVGGLSTASGLSRGNIKGALEASLRRLKTDYVDICYAHKDDQTTPLDEVHEAFNELIAAGKVRHVAASNFSGPRLEELLAFRGENGDAWLCGYQDRYNLVERSTYEHEVRPMLEAAGVPLLPFYALANGFLTGKYRPGQAVDSKRASIVAPYLESSTNLQVLDVMDEIAEDHGTSVTAVGLAWLRVQPTVATPVASVTKTAQLPPLLESASLTLSHEELRTLSEISVGE